MMDELLGVCAQADIESVKPITITILKLVRLSIDSDVLFLKEGDYELAMSMLKKGNILERIDTILAENPYTSDISIHSIAMSAVADNLLSSGYDEEQFEELTNALAQAVNTVNRRGAGSVTEKVSALTSQTKKHLEGYGIKVSTEMAQMVAKELVLKLGDTAEVTAQDIREIIENYAND
jgi:predicted Zn-dependent peptidase